MGLFTDMISRPELTDGGSPPAKADTSYHIWLEDTSLEKLADNVRLSAPGEQ